MKRIVKMSIYITLFIIFGFILSLVLFYFLDKFIEIDNKIIRFVTILLASIIGYFAMEIIRKKVD